MNKGPDINMSDIVDTLEEDDTQTDTDVGAVYHDEHQPSDLLGKMTIIGGAIVLVIIIFILFPSEKSNVSKADFNALIERVKRIEAHMKEIEGVEERMTALLQSHRDSLRKSVTATAGRETRVQTDKNRYHVVVRGDNLSSIAATYGLTLDELCNLNGITPQKPIHPGQKLMVSSVSR